MERFANLGGGGSGSTSNASFLQLPLPAASAQQVISPEAQEDPSRLALQQLLAEPSSSAPTIRHSHQKDGVVQGEMSPADAETIKAKIMSHPQYSALLTAYLDCQKVGAPPNVSDRLSAVAAKLDVQQWQDRRRPPPHADPELDQFMEAYCNMLVKFQEELAQPIQEAAEFFKSVEKQLDSITDSSTCEGGAGSSEDEQDTSCAEEVDPCAEDKELKHQLLRKYGGYLGGLRQEFSKRKKRGKLPKEARQKLLHWWEVHYKWPYPSETEKIALAEATGLDPKQINNWFINQRKRHWKPTSEDMEMPFAATMMEGGFHVPQLAAAAALYMDKPFMADHGMYHHRLGSS